jgi:D-alanyl-lipoteichoic acid acyltransferase DltB (MBOAT superfamily)
MLFHTSTFLLFFSIFLPVYALARRLRLGPLVIVLFSQVFYGWWDPYFLILLWFTIILDYGLAIAIDRTTSQSLKRLYLVTSIGASLSILAYFKYSNLFLTTIFDLPIIAETDDFTLQDLIIPVGVSFYTFQSMSYIIDVYRKTSPPIYNLINYAAFVCYFPHMIAGPIQRIETLLPQILGHRQMDWERTASGVLVFAYGFLLKSLGDTLASVNDPIFADVVGATPGAIVTAIFGFGLQIYFDFNGYCEMARGVSRIIGIELIRNFDSPYLSLSLREFWRRWHISLSQWLRDYLYIGLGGNRVAKIWQHRNLLLTMALGGLWHGAGWNFLIWGTVHGLYLVLNVMVNDLLRQLKLSAMSEFPLIRLSRWVLTFVLVNYAWLYFRSESFEDTLTIHHKLGQFILTPEWPTFPPGLLLIAAIVVGLEGKRLEVTRVFESVPSTLQRHTLYGAVAGVFVLLGVIFLAGRPSQQFIYFQF